MTGTKERFEHCTSKKPFPLSILCEPCLIHRWVFLPFPPSSLNCCLPNPLFFLLIPPVFSLSPSPAPCVPSCLPSCVLMSSFWNPPQPPTRYPHRLFSNSRCSVSHLLHPSLLGFVFLCDETHAHGFLRRQQVVTDAVTKLPIKSMFNSDDWRPLTEKVEAFHL